MTINSVLNANVIRKIAAGLGLTNASVPTQVAKAIVPVYVSNDENNPFGVHIHNFPYMQFPGRYTTNTTSNDGSFTTTTTTQTAIERFLNSSSAASNTLYTVTTGKTLYVKSFFISNLAGVNQAFGIHDAGTAVLPVADTIYSIVRLKVTVATAAIFVFTSDAPLAFTTAFSSIAAGATEHSIGFSGWEE